LIIQYQVKDN